MRIHSNLMNMIGCLEWNKTANFNKRTYISGYNNKSSMIDDFIENANGTIDIDEFNNLYSGISL